MPVDLLRREEDLAPGAGEKSDGSSEDGNAADESGVLSGSQGIVCRGDEALGGAAALFSVNSLGRHSFVSGMSLESEADQARQGI